MSNRKTPVRFTVDFEKKQIIGTQAALNKAKRYGSEEYQELCKLTEAHPRFRVVPKKVSDNKSKKTYKSLNFEFIETYISIQINADKIKREYEQAKQIAADLSLGVYPHTKSWFLKKFSTEDKPFDMNEAREEISNARLAAAQAEAAV